MIRRVVLVVLGVQAGIVAIFFLAANQEWAEVVVPGAPWTDRARFVTIEVKVWALVVGSFLVGAIATAMFVGTKRGRRRPREEEPWPTDRDRLA